jgi:hypothetical protein
VKHPTPSIAARAALIALAVAAALFPCGCKKKADYERLNAQGECLEIDILPADELLGDDDSASLDDDDAAGDDDDSAAGADDGCEEGYACIELHGRPSFFNVDVIGRASVTPTQGPARTRFEVGVELVDTGEETGNPVDVVDRVTVQVDNGSVVINEFDLAESPADYRLWGETLGTGGDPATTRRIDDKLCVILYAEVE